MKPDKRVLRQFARLYAIAVDDVIKLCWMEDEIEIIQNLPDDCTFAASRRSGQTDDARVSETDSKGYGLYIGYPDETYTIRKSVSRLV